MTASNWTRPAVGVLRRGVCGATTALAIAACIPSAAHAAPFDWTAGIGNWWRQSVSPIFKRERAKPAPIAATPVVTIPGNVVQLPDGAARPNQPIASATPAPAVVPGAPRSTIDHGTPLYEDLGSFKGPGMDLTSSEFAIPDPDADAGGGTPSGGGPTKTNTSNWWSYRIDVGSHTSNVIRGSVGDRPRHGLNWNTGRTYQFAFDSSAAYVLAPPYMADPADQLDWNKLPGFSDCGNTSLSKNGAMFGWRWNIEREVLEITAYWNNDSKHLWPDQPLLTLTRAELASGDPLTYAVSAERDHYAFSIKGTIAGRVVDIKTTGSRACPGRNRLKWNSAFYFGGTSTAPQTITGKIYEDR